MDRPPPPAVLVLHGVFMQVFELGVLLAGDSGVGKSELAMELLARGHRLIADDVVECSVDGDEVVGRCPGLLKGFLELRGLGVLNIERMFGPNALLPRARLDLILRLQLPGLADEAVDRIGGQRQRRCLLGRELAEISLPIRPGYNLAAVVEAASRDQMLRRNGYDAAADFVERQRQAIARSGESR